MPECYFAELPQASRARGAIRWVIDVGVSGSLWRSDGIEWCLVGGHSLLAQSNVAKSVTVGSTTEELLDWIAIPGTAIGLNGALRFSSLWSANVSASNKSLRARLGAVALSGSAVFASTSAMANQASMAPTPHVIRNRNSFNSQVCFPAANGGIATVSGSPVTAFAENTANDVVFAITGQKATGTDTLTLEGWSLELLRP